MGDYNPRAPRILGEEWVPIRDEDVEFSPASNSTELGSKFTLPASTRVRSARVYIHSPAPGDVNNQTLVASIYRPNGEHEGGPIRSVIIPVNSGAVTGTGASSFSSTVAQALYDPTDIRYIGFITGPFSGMVYMNFPISSYAPLLSNKRILAVSLVYTLTGQSDVEPLGRGLYAFIQNNSSLAFPSSLNSQPFGLVVPQSETALIPAGDFGRKYFGEINGFSSGTTVTKFRMPWTYTQLQRLEATSSSPLYVVLRTFDVSADLAQYALTLYYAALEVFYCEEGREVFGALSTDPSGSDPFDLGANDIPLYTLAGAADPVLSAGERLLTVSSANLGDLISGSISYQPVASSVYPALNGLRELYSIPTHPGVRVDIPFPVTENVIGESITAQDWMVLPQISLHASGGPLTEPHVYGRQAAAQVYGSLTATQEIDDTGWPAATYPQVRFYARRFGDTTVPLSLLGGGGGLLLPGAAGSYASTPDNAVLDITGDIDLRADISPNDWSPLAAATLISKWTTAPQRSYILNLLPAGTLQFAWSVDGTAATVRESTAAISATSDRLTVRVTLDVNNGAGGHDVIFYTGPTVDGPWTQLGTTITTAGVTSIFSSTTQAEVGAHTGGTVNPFAGVVHIAQIHPGINVGPTAAPNFEAQAAGTTVFVDSVGRTWTLNGSAAIIGGTDASSVSITPEEFDVLGEIIDGWKEVTLRFDTAPLMGGESNPRWTWSATGETAGNRWEVLGAIAPALSGIPGNLLNLVPSPNQLGIATYGGDDVNLGWAPGYSPLVSVTTSDPSSDAVLIFAQDMPTVTGLSVVGASQELVGIGLDCGIDPCGIPTDLLYNEITWSPTSSGIPASGFGFYELQRMDEITDWETIMMASSPLTSGFSDYEARVDILTSYRMRAVDVLEFAGPWSDTVTITMPAPGVSGSCLEEAHILVFTSNEYQDGSLNLAYSTAWTERVDETFSFPEAGGVQMQAMYDRDYFVAFHPTERSGVQFERNILVQAAAIAPPTLEDFTSLRDMAWADVSYICVRDEEGNRWLANVVVPAGSVQNRRKLYLSTVRITEVTATPSPVDPS